MIYLLAFFDCFIFIWCVSYLVIRIVYLKKQKQIFSMLDWSNIGIFIFFIFPYFLGRMGIFEFKYNPSNEEVVYQGIGLVFLFVIFTYIGYYSSRVVTKKIANSVSRIRFNLNFLKKVIIIGVFLALFLIVNILNSIGLSNMDNNYILREKLSSFGPLVILLQIPLGVSVYFWGELIKHKTKVNLLNAVFFMICATVIAFIRGQRTDLILIFLLPLIVLYAYKNTLKPLILGITCAFFFAILYATIFKSSYQLEGVTTFSDGIATFLNGDIDRNWTLWLTLENTDFISSNILPYYGSGYIYTFFAYIPRFLAPFKGYSTESWFTFLLASNVGDNAGAVSISDLSWGYAFGGIVEGILNFGIVGILFVGYFYGIAIRMLNTIVENKVDLYAVSSIICIDLAAYGAFTILIIQVPILITVLILNHSYKKKQYFELRS
ncbi:O-antigen polysaccharide polymerase Wzy [Bacillus sp. NPDC094106]|uniref:O-antigen polysaccharide polymerase Wzy n=1 Tax=Bacillus sp. NPDC094106 TaxID=3363949 RepID=UPI003826B3F8